MEEGQLYKGALSEPWPCHDKKCHEVVETSGCARA